MTGPADFEPFREKSLGARLQVRFWQATPELRVTKHGVCLR